MALALVALHAGPAPAAIEAGQVTLAKSLDGRGEPVAPLGVLEYPSIAVVHVRLRGLEPGRTYLAYATVREARGITVQNETWTFVAKGDSQGVSFPLKAYGAYAEGEWSYELHVGGTKVVERKVQAVKRLPAPPPKADLPPVKAERVVFATAISRAKQPFRPLEAVSVSAPFYYFLDVQGLKPGYNHQAHILVRDGAGKAVDNRYYGHVAQREQEAFWIPVVPKPGHAPGTWTLRFELDERLVSEDVIEARAGRAVARDALDEHALPAILGVLLFVALYVGGHIVAAPRSKVVPTRPSAKRASWLDPSLVLLVAANLVPLGLVFHGGLGASDLLILYWIENFVVALYAILRITLVRGERGGAKAFTILFFMLHFGMFCLVLGGVLWQVAARSSSFLVLDPVAMHGPATGDAFEASIPLLFGITTALALQACALLLSHGFSFVHNYLGRHEYVLATAKEEMTRPYNRLVAMHLATIGAGFFASSQGSPLWTLVALVAIKTGIDIRAHLRSHAVKT